MSERIDLAEIEARRKRAIDGWSRIWNWSALCAGDEDAQLLGSDLPALIAWVKEAKAVLQESAGEGPMIRRTTVLRRTIQIKSLLSRLEVE